VQDTTAMQYLLLCAHAVLEQEKQNSGGISEVDANDIWNKKIEEANERADQRRKSKEELVKEAQDKIIRQIEENKK